MIRMKMMLLLIVEYLTTSQQKSKSFGYKKKLIRNIPDNDGRLDAEDVIPLKYLSNFFGFLGLPLINYEIECDFSWSRNWVIFEI